jgi:cytosine/uracil/thiamine/allantoin permease
MNTPVSLKTAERKAFRTTLADGLWDIFIACLLLSLAIAPLFSATLGDFWSSAIFLPIYGLVYLAIWLLRKHVIRPRIGTVKFGAVRQKKLRRFTTIMLVLNVLVFVAGLVVALVVNFQDRAQFGWLISLFLGLFVLMGFSMAGTLLDTPRYYLYGLMLLAAPPIGEWLYQQHGFTHHGYPVVFGFSAAVMILTGLVLFLRLLKNNPRIEVSPEESAS